MKATITEWQNDSSVSVAGWQSLQLHIKTQIKTNVLMDKMMDDELKVILVTDSLRARIQLGQKYIISGWFDMCRVE